MSYTVIAAVAAGAAIGAGAAAGTAHAQEDATIPAWIKSIFAYYADGQITDAELVSALEFLIGNGVINVGAGAGGGQAAGAAAQAPAAGPAAPGGGQAAGAAAPTSAAPAAHERAIKAQDKAHSLQYAVRTSPQAAGGELAEAAEAWAEAAEAWAEAAEAWEAAGNYERAAEAWGTTEGNFWVAFNLGDSAAGEWSRSGDKRKAVQWGATKLDMREQRAMWNERWAAAAAEAGNHLQAAEAYGAAGSNWRQLGTQYLPEGRALAGASERAAEMSERSAAMTLEAGFVANAIDQYRWVGGEWTEAGNYERAFAAYGRAADLLGQEASEWEAAGDGGRAADMREGAHSMFADAASAFAARGAYELAAAIYDDRLGSKLSAAGMWYQAGNYGRAAAAYMAAGDEYAAAAATGRAADMRESLGEHSWGTDGASIPDLAAIVYGHAGSAYDSAGNIWARAGDNGQARAAYERALAAFERAGHASDTSHIEQALADLD